MGNFFRGIAVKVVNFVTLRRMFRVISKVADTGTFVGSKRVAVMTLSGGDWLILAKASVKGFGGNAGLTDCRLKVTAVEDQHVESDESYESPAPLLGSTMMVMLPFRVADQAQVQLQADVQGQDAEFVKMRFVALRDLNTI